MFISKIAYSFTTQLYLLFGYLWYSLYYKYILNLYVKEIFDEGVFVVTEMTNVRTNLVGTSCM